MKRNVLIGIIVVLLLVMIIEATYIVTRRTNNKIIAGNIEKVEYAAKNWWEGKNLELLNVEEDEKVAVDIDELIKANLINSSDVSTIGTEGCVLIKYNTKTQKLEYDYSNSDECEIYSYDMSMDISDECTAGEKDVLYGDINLDGKITFTDRTYLTRYLAGWEGYDLYCNAMLNADLNLDKSVDLDDLTILSKYLSKIDGYSKLPIKQENIVCDYNNLKANSGDIDKDGKVTSKDKDLLARYLESSQTLDCQALLNADVNMDGKVDIEDLDKLTKHLSGWSGYEDLTKDNSKIECDYSNLKANVGDVDKDGKVTSSDRTSLARYLENSQTLDCQALLNADVNKDGKVDTEDLNALAKHLAGWEGYEDLNKNNSSQTNSDNKLKATYGDVNKDDKVTSSDRTSLARYLNGSVSLDNQSLLNADVNADGKVDENDLEILTRYLAGWDEYKTLPKLN